MPPPKKKSKKNVDNGYVTDGEPSPRVTRRTRLSDSKIESDSSSLITILEPSEEFPLSPIEISTSKASAPVRKRSFKKLSIKLTECIPVNDDCSELREERNDSIPNKYNISRDKSCSQDEEEQEMSILQSMTVDQMREHVSHCLQLSTENKINSKNAFALKLIDCMTVISKNMEDNDFTAAACQLDAGAKIYSHRIDAVHQQAKKLVDTCIFAERWAKIQSAVSEGQDSLNNNYDETPGGNVKNKQNKSKKKVIATSSDQISRKLKRNDPREIFVKCEALPGGIFDKVRSDPTDLSLSLVKHTPFWMDWQNYKPVKAEGVIEIRSIVIKNWRLGPVLEIEKDEFGTPKLEDLHSIMRKPSVVDFEDKTLSDMLADKGETTTNSEADKEFEMVSVAMRRMQEEGNQVSRLEAMNAVFHKPGESDYHYLKEDNSYYWAGPGYWSRPRGPVGTVNSKKVIRKKNEPIHIKYTVSAISPHTEQCSPGSALKRTTTLSGRVLSGWKEKNVTFPEDIQFQAKTLLNLFHVETESDSLLNNPAQIDAESPDFDFGNEDDVQHLEVRVIVDNKDILTVPQNDGEDCEHGQPKPHKEASKKVENKEEETVVGYASTPICGSSEPCDVYEGENLVPMVKTVKFEPIKFTSKPNTVDMRHLKEVLLAIVLQEIEDKENKMISEGIEDPHGSVQFKNILIKLFHHDKLHYRTRQDLTTAMAFLGLLSIASEHAFHMINDKTGDVTISLRSDKIMNLPTTSTCFSDIQNTENNLQHES